MEDSVEIKRFPCTHKLSRLRINRWQPMWSCIRQFGKKLPVPAIKKTQRKMSGWVRLWRSPSKFCHLFLIACTCWWDVDTSPLERFLCFIHLYYDQSFLLVLSTPQWDLFHAISKDYRQLSKFRIKEKRPLKTRDDFKLTAGSISIYTILILVGKWMGQWPWESVIVGCKIMWSSSANRRRQSR